MIGYLFKKYQCTEKECVYAKVDGVYLYSCYAPPSLTYTDHENLLNKIVTHAGRHPKVIVGEFNAYCQKSGAADPQTREKTLLETFAAEHLLLI